MKAGGGSIINKFTIIVCIVALFDRALAPANPEYASMRTSRSGFVWTGILLFAVERLRWILGPWRIAPYAFPLHWRPSRWSVQPFAPSIHKPGKRPDYFSFSCAFFMIVLSCTFPERFSRRAVLRTWATSNGTKRTWWLLTTHAAAPTLAHVREEPYERRLVFAPACRTVGHVLQHRRDYLLRSPFQVSSARLPRRLRARAAPLPTAACPLYSPLPSPCRMWYM